MRTSTAQPEERSSVACGARPRPIPSSQHTRWISGRTSFASTPPAVASATSRRERCRRREKARLLRRTRARPGLMRPAFANDLFRAGSPGDGTLWRELRPCDDAEQRRQRLAAPRDVPRYGQHHPVDMTIVCLDILEKILIESRKSNGQPPLSSDTVASGLDGSSNKTDRTRKRGNSPPPRAFVTQASVTGNDVA